MKIITYFSIALIGLLVLGVDISHVIAQGSLPPPALPTPPSQTPIDGGLALLAVGGSAYAWRKLQSLKK